MKHILSFDDYLYENNEILSEKLIKLNIEIIDESNKVSIGEIIVNKEIKDDILKIFEELKNIGYPIECMKPAKYFDNDDDKSMEHNNTYSYCHRYIRYTKKLSPHSFGICIDINPKYNPCVRLNEDGSIKSIFPKNGEKYADRNLLTPYTITPEVVSIFKKYGFEWGGDWEDKKDYHHFERKDLREKYTKKGEL